ncbi:OLC1v1035299C1 [Oldenlandia corymbosa var. corymbosa]|uniref:OLC1v1035299C1 n=1 Tax=Oldenlandia corymbosa var. corymbosa TaxID=529605 RepID=A0AAV1CSQ5_OLDCO|nr:OLC1v1035299C1 [Oldenlandia corymbosa var. corymbosa]
MWKSKSSRVDESWTLPVDLIWEILKLIPVKTLLRCKCVCKLWLSITRDPLFISSYGGGFKGLLVTRSHHDIYQNHDFFYMNLSPEGHHNNEDVGVSSHISEFHTLNLGQPMKSKAPVNGLVCFYHGKNSCIYNIATRETMYLPVSNCDLDICDYHLGYDPFNRVYKVLKTCTLNGGRGDCPRPRHKHILNCEILTIGVDSSWRSIDPAPWELSSSAYCGNGGLYWDSNFSRSIGVSQFICFDLVQENFKFITKPRMIGTFRWLFGPKPAVERCSNVFYNNHEGDHPMGPWIDNELRSYKRATNFFEDIHNLSSWTEHNIRVPEGKAVTTLPNGDVIFLKSYPSNWKFPMPFYVYERTSRELKKRFIADCPSSSIAQECLLNLTEPVVALYYEENITPLGCLGSS